MSNKTWKAFERRIAKMFGGKRRGADWPDELRHWKVRKWPKGLLQVLLRMMFTYHTQRLCDHARVTPRRQWTRKDRVAWHWAQEILNVIEPDHIHLHGPDEPHTP